MQAYFESEQAFSIRRPQPVFDILIAFKKKNVVEDFIQNFKGIICCKYYRKIFQ